MEVKTLNAWEKCLILTCRTDHIYIYSVGVFSDDRIGTLADNRSSGSPHYNY